MIGLLKDWWRLRGERLCAQHRHAWADCAAPVPPATTDPMIALVHMLTSPDWQYSVCTRCGQLGRRIRERW